MKETSGEKITRIAPTPSGYLHAGNAFSFVLTALVAHLEKAEILLRIDDLDQQRYRSSYADDIFRTLNRLGIEWQHGPQCTSDLETEWSQAHRMDIYEGYLQKLWESHKVFVCECSRKELYRKSKEATYTGTCRGKALLYDAPNTALRFFTDNRNLEVKLWPYGAATDVLPSGMRDFVVRRKDRIPAYQLTSLADDLHFGVNLIVRGEDLYPSSLAQVFLAQELMAKNFLEARFFHHKLIRSQQGNKLSKSAGADAVNLESKSSTEQLFRQFSRWLQLDEEAGDLQGLKQMMSRGNLISAGLG